MERYRVLLVNQSYTPDRGASGQLLGELFSRLCDSRVEVTVVAGPPTYTDEDIPWAQYEEIDGLRVIRVGSARFKGRKSLFNRVAAYITFLLSAFLVADRLARTERFDVVTTASNPPFVGLIGAWCRTVHHLPFVYMLHDLHPDMAVKTRRFRIPSFIRVLWDYFNKVVFVKATMVVVLGDSMKDYLQKYKAVPADKIKVIHPWAIPEVKVADKLNRYRLENGIGPEQLLVLYFGNISSTHSLEMLVEAAANLRDRPVLFHFVGGGPDKPALEYKCGQLGLRNVVFLPYQTGQRFLDIMAAADISVTSLTPGLEGLAVPSKTYSILASGRPVLALCSEASEVAWIVRSAQCGWVVHSAEGVVKAISEAFENKSVLESMGMNARKWYDTFYSRDRAVNEYMKVFERASRNPGS